MSRRVAWIIATVLVAMLFASVTTSGGVQMWGEPQWDPAPRQREPVEREESAPTTTPPPIEQRDERVVEVPGWIDAVVRVVLVVLAMTGLIALLTAGWRRRPRLRWRRRFAPAGDFDVVPDVAAAIVDEAVAQRTALLTGEARNGIVRCWLQLEADVAAVGLARNPADTSAEFTERVLARYTVDQSAIRDLAALYREARFSAHRLDETARESALGALDRLHEGLREFALDGVDSATSVGATS